MEIKKIKVLAIDDNPDNLISLNALIKEAFPEATVFTAISGKRGLELSLQEDPDVILLDIVMPGMDGFEVCRKLKADQKLSDIPVVFVTALKGDKDSRIKALECGGEAFLAKPVDESELTAQIRAMVKIKTANTDKRSENERLKRLVDERTSKLEAELSERKRTEKALTESEEKYRIMVELLPDAVIIHEGGKFVFANATALKTVGADSFEQLMERPLMDYVHPDFRAISLSRIRKIYSTGQPSTFSEEKFITLKGEIIDVEVIGIPIFYLGKPAIQTIIRDITVRKKAEDELKESEERFRHITSSISDISFSCETDPSGSSTINWLYGAVEEITGYTPEELIAMKCWGKLVVAEDFPIFKSQILKVLPDCSDECQLRIRKKDGSIVWVQASAECAKDPAGSSFNILYGGLVDITNEKRIEQALQESEAKFREFFEKAADAIFIAEIETGIIVDVNAAATRLMNRSYDQLVGIHQSQLHTPVKEDYTKDTFNTHKELVKQKVNSHALENTVVRADGTEVPIEILASEVEYHGKSCIMGTFRDITERKRAEEAIKQSETRLKDAQQIAHIGSYHYDAVNDQSWWSDELFRLYGLEPTNKPFSRAEARAFTHPDNEYTGDGMIKQSIGTDGAVESEYKIIRLDGAVRYHYAVMRISKDDSGQMISIDSIIQDITDRKLAEDAIRKSESMLRTMIESAPFEIWARDKNGYGILENENQVRHFGSILGKTPDDKGISPEISQLWNSNNKRVMNGEIVDDECIYLVDGVERNFHQILAPILIDGSIEGITGFNIDITERKRAEELLRESEYFFRESQRAAFVGSYKFDLIADYWTSSEVLEQIFGIDKSYNKSLQSWIEIVHPDDREMMTQYFLEEVVGKRQPFNKEYRIVSQLDGDIRWVLGLGRLKFDAEGNVTEMIGTIQDISERKLAEQARNDSYEFNKSLLKTIPFGMDIVDEEGTVLFQSENFENIFGKGAIGKKCWEIYRDDQTPCNGCPLNEGIQLGKTETCETASIFGGSVFEVNHTGMMFKGKKALLEIFQDITERKLAEAQLREVNQRFADLVASTDGIVWESDADTPTFNFISKNAERILGYQSEEWFEPNFWVNHIYEDDRDNIVQFHYEQCRQKKDHNLEYRFERRDGQIIWLSDSVKIIEEGKAKTLHGLMVDITERKQAEKALKESQQLFQELFNASPDAIVLIDPVDRPVSWPILDCNEATCKMNGYTREEMIGQSIDFLNLTVGTLEERISYFNKLRQEKVIHTESYHRHKNGHIFPIEVSTSIVMIGGRELILGIDRDITDRKLAEETVRKSEVRLKRAELASKSGNWEFYLDSQAIVVSEGALKIYGIEGLQFKYEEIKNIPLLEYRSALDTAMKNLLENDIPYDIEFKIKAVNTHQIKDVHSVAFFDREKRIIFGIIQDITDRKQAEVELIKSQDRYRRFISQISEGVYRFESDEPMDLSIPVEDQIDFIYDHMFIAECNQAFQKMYGIGDQMEVIGKSHLDFHGGRDNPVNRSALREFVNSGYHVEDVMTEEINPGNGQQVYFNNNSLGIIENNQLVRIWGTQADVTEKIRADQVKQVLFSISNAALSSIDLPKLIEFISKEVGKLLDATNFYIAFYDEKTDMLSTIYERDEKDVFETWPAENSITGYVVKQQKSLLLKEEDVDDFYKAEGIRAHGTPSKVWLGVPLKTNKKTIGAIVVQSYVNVDEYTENDQQMLEFISHQISISIERKRTEKDLKLMGKAFDQSPVTIVITDVGGNIEYVNPKFSETTGYSFEEVKGENPRVLKSGHQSKEYYKDLWDTVLAGKDWFGEFQNRRKNGETYWESAVISPITNDNGEIAFFLAIKEDITEKKKMIDDLVHARNKAEESDRLKSSFLANMSHEIRTPLNSIIGFSELLLDKEFGAEQHEEFARTINYSGNGLLTIISDIMDLSKIEAGQITINKKPFPAQKLLIEIQREYSIKASAKGIELIIDPENLKNEILVISDVQRLKQVLINFVGNAIKFTDKGFIEVGFRVQGNNIYFSVKDTGIGIPRQYHQEIFERFRQVEVAHTRKYGGNGLGLAISKSLIEMLGGEIGMISEQGVGSTFYFTIPLS